MVSKGYLTDNQVRHTQAAAMGKLCRVALKRAQQSYVTWCNAHIALEDEYDLSKKAWKLECDDAQEDAVGYARRAANAVLV